MAGRGAMYRLGAELRALREEARLSGRALGQRLGWSQAKVSRIEKADVRASVEDVQALLDHLRVSVRRRRELLALAREASDAAGRWRPSHRSGPRKLRAQLDTLVRTAADVRHFQPTTVPGLLQTAEYARHAVQLADLTGDHDVDGLVAAQLTLQRILFEPDCPPYHFLLGEAVLRDYPDAAAELHRAQLDRIVSVAGLPRVTVQVLPANAPNAALGRHGFRIYDFTDPDEPPVVFLETIGGEMTVHERVNVEVFVATWQRLLAGALGPIQSLELIRARADAASAPSGRS